jgi:chromosome segregation ATPase
VNINYRRSDVDETTVARLEKENQQLKKVVSDMDVMYESIREAEQNYRTLIENKSKEIAELMSELNELQLHYHELEMAYTSARDERELISKSLDQKQREHLQNLEMKNGELAKLRHENQQMKYKLSDLESLAKVRSETEIQEKSRKEKQREELQRLEYEVKELRRYITDLENTKKVLEIEKQSLETMLLSQDHEGLSQMEAKNKELATLYLELKHLEQLTYEKDDIIMSLERQLNQLQQVYTPIQDHYEAIKQTLEEMAPSSFKVNYQEIEMAMLTKRNTTAFLQKDIDKYNAMLEEMKKIDGPYDVGQNPEVTSTIATTTVTTSTITITSINEEKQPIHAMEPLNSTSNFSILGNCQEKEQELKSMIHSLEEEKKRLDEDYRYLLKSQWKRIILLQLAR